ncbi:MAG: hypothetical protein LPJ89_08105, partial [Hymenobacteraceae bacterium]|nr:hypothetical protein [Hymenobacteraceae bacterium]MDX5396498.1 hypothetical protein [Hymenobacteraceae bacterium]MDX5443726.1 hypothetical protein [Hymenobacteraceae bacterium]MDX5512562.1 hypothetical protein [Hymenobacteraceae bacterium]
TELEMVAAYVFLMKIRFGENLQVQLNVPQEYFSSSIPPLTLQMLLENAIKHNIISMERPLHINVYVEKGSLLVKNNLQKKAVRDGESTKIGLQNIINRYSYLTENNVDVITTSDNFIVALPVLEFQKQEALV